MSKPVRALVHRILAAALMAPMLFVGFTATTPAPLAEALRSDFLTSGVTDIACPTNSELFVRFNAEDGKDISQPGVTWVDFVAPTTGAGLVDEGISVLPVGGSTIKWSNAGPNVVVAVVVWGGLDGDFTTYTYSPAQGSDLTGLGDGGDRIFHVGFCKQERGQGTIGGLKFNDKFNVGIKDAPAIDPRLSAWTIQLFTCTDGTFTSCAFTTSALTDNPTGTYSFGALIQGFYQVCEVQQPLFAQTFPHAGTPAQIGAPAGTTAVWSPSGCWSVTLPSVLSVLGNIDFGNRKAPKACRTLDPNCP